MKETQHESLPETLRARFEKNMNRHADLEWADVLARLESNPGKLQSLAKMEASGGEPDVVVFDEGGLPAGDSTSGEFVFCDCSPETPAGRRSMCYDRAGLEERKDFKPEHSAVEMAADMGIELLTEAVYRELQKLGEFDLKTSSWLKTPANIRTLGGAIFGDRRYDTVFVYHNGAQSYYAVRGFRGLLRV